MRVRLLALAVSLASAALPAQQDLRTRSMFRSPGTAWVEVFARSDGFVDVQARRFALNHHCLLTEDAARLLARDLRAMMDRRITVAAGEENTSHVAARGHDCELRIFRVTSAAQSTYAAEVTPTAIRLVVEVPLTRPQATLFLAGILSGSDSTAAMTRRSRVVERTREALEDPDRLYRDHELTAPASPVGDSVRPRYPDILRAGGVRGDVFVQFIVDANGRTEPTSVRIFEATDSLFAAAVRDALIGAQFTPAKVAGVRVRNLKHGRFAFVPPAP
jgi:TonB family protein